MFLGCTWILNENTYPDVSNFLCWTFDDLYRWTNISNESETNPRMKKSNKTSKSQRSFFWMPSCSFGTNVLIVLCWIKLRNLYSCLLLNVSYTCNKIKVEFGTPGKISLLLAFKPKRRTPYNIFYLEPVSNLSWSWDLEAVLT